MEDTKEKRFVGLDGLKHFWTKAKTWIAGQITAEVTTKISELVANAPEDLDTLKEIADWISAHADSASAMNTQITANRNEISSLQTTVAGKANTNHTHDYAASSHTHDDRYYTETEIDTKLSGLGKIPPATILSGFYTTAPDGFLLCNGQEVAIADYPELYAVIGGLEICKSSNAVMFKLPNLQDQFLQGANRNLGTMKEAGLPNITGNFSAQVAETNQTKNGAFYANGERTHCDGGTSNPTYPNGFSFSASRSSSIYGKSNTVQPPAICVNYVIKY